MAKNSMGETKSNFQVHEIALASSHSSCGTNNDRRTASADEKSRRNAPPRASVFLFASASDWAFFVPGSIFIVIAAMASPLQTYLYGKLFQYLAHFVAGRISLGQFLSRSRVICGAVIGMGAARMLCTWAGEALWLLAGERQQDRARRAIFRTLVARPVAWFDARNTLMGEMAQVCRNIEEVRAAASLNTALLISEAAGVTFLFAMAMVSLWRLTLVVMALAPVMAVCSGVFGRQTFVHAEAENRASARASHILDWAFAQGDLVRILNGRDADAARFSRAVECSQAAFVRMAAAMCANGAILRMLGNLLFVQGFWYGHHLVSEGNLKIGELVTAIGSCLLLGSQVAGLATTLAHRNQGRAAAATIQEFGFTEVKQQHDEKLQCVGLKLYATKEKPQESFIEFSGVSFGYDHRLTLQNVSAVFCAPSLNFVVGRSGSGKSTLAQLAMNFYSPLQGSVLFNGVNIQNLADWGSEVMLVELTPQVFERTVGENVAMVGAAPEEVIRACQFARIDPSLAADCLSGGQIQQVGLARARARDPAVLILDEALCSIDTVTRAAIWRELRAWRRGRVTIVITHDLSEAAPDDHVVLLEDGKVVADSMNSKINAINFSSDLPKHGFPSTASLLDVSDSNSDMTITSETLDTSSSDTQESVAGIFRILRFFWATTPSCALLFFGALLCAVSAGATPALSFCTSKLLLASVSARPAPPRFMVRWSLVCIGVILGDTAAHFLGHWAVETALELWIVHLRKHAAAAVNDQDMLFFATRDHHPARLTTLVMNDARDLRALVAEFVAGAILVVVLTVSGLLWALVSGWQLALVGLAFIPAVVGALALFGALMLRAETKYKKRVASAEAFNRTVVAGVRTVKACGLAQAVARDFDGFLARIRVSGRVRAVATGFGLAFLELCTSAATGTVMYYGMALVAKMTYSQQQMVETLSLLTFTLVGAAGLVHLLPQIARGQRAGTKMARLVQLTPLEVETGGTGEKIPAALARPAPPGVLVLSLEHVDFAYGDAETCQYRRVLRNANLEVRAGECVALLGQSGSGKSTAARLFARLWRADRGRIVFRGRDVLLLDPHWYREQVVVVPQRPRVFEGSVRANLCYGTRPAPDEELWRALEVCQAAEIVRLLPGGLDAPVADCALSLGQLQRLCVARAVLRRPQVLVFDECTLHLDRATADAIAKVMCGGLQARAPHLAVVVITHDAAVAQRCGRAVRINSGEIRN